MKKLFFILTFGLLMAVFVPQEAEAQRTRLVYDQVDVGDSTIENWSFAEDVHKWDSVYIEVLYTGLAAADTTAQVEIYNTLNGDFTDATNLAGSNLVAADGAGGTGTIMKTLTLAARDWARVRFVCDPSDDDTGAAKISMRLKPVYKEVYGPLKD